MASESDHVTLANKNHDTLVYLLDKPQQFSEWITTIAFYKAVHIVEAVFSRDPNIKHCHDHGSRNGRLSADHRYRQIYKHYRPLWQASTIARYLSDNESNTQYRSFSDYLKPDQVIPEIVKHRLRSIEQSAVGFLTARAQESLKLN